MSISLLVRYHDQIKNSVTQQTLVLDKIRPYLKNGTPPRGRLRVRELLIYAINLCEKYAKLKELTETEPSPELTELEQDLDTRDGHLKKTFELINAMRLPNGKVKWFWKDSGSNPSDRNATDFAMRNAVVLRRNYSDLLQEKFPEQWNDLDALMRAALTPCINYHPSWKHTNIALLNILNLLSLGEIYGDQTALQKGHERLETLVENTRNWGVYENLSPTYTPVQIDCLGLMLNHLEEAEQKNIEKLLVLLWWNVGLNAQTFPEMQYTDPDDDFAPIPPEFVDIVVGNALPKLSAQSILSAGPRLAPPEDGDELEKTISSGKVAQMYKILTQEGVVDAINFPRTIRASWGKTKNRSRTAHLLEKISLSSIHAPYNIPAAGDLPVSVVLQDVRQQASPRFFTNILSIRSPGMAYLLTGVKNNPYDRKAKRHRTLLWAAAQYETDVLGVALYRPGKRRIKTSFVLPLGEEVEFWKNHAKFSDISNTRQPQAKGELRVDVGDAIFLRCNDVAIGIRVIWSRNLKGEEAPILLKYDQQKERYMLSEEECKNISITENANIEIRPNENEFNILERRFPKVTQFIPAVQLTVFHDIVGANSVNKPQTRAGAAIWVRIWDKNENEIKNFQEWRQSFIDAKPTVGTKPIPGGQANRRRLRFEVPAENDEEKLVVEARRNEKNYLVNIAPSPSRAVLELGGQDIGKALLDPSFELTPDA